MNKLKELKEELITNRSLGKLFFFEKECKSCINTNKQKDRKCIKLVGYPDFSCRKKELFLNKYNDKIRNRILDKCFDVIKNETKQ